MTLIHAEAAGTYAFEALKQVRDGQVFGVTSAGVFIKTGGQVFFLTGGKRCGPVTINLPGRCSQLSNVQAGDPVQFGDGRLALPGVGFVICVESSQVWRAPEPGYGCKLDRAGARARLASLAAVLLTARPGKGLSWLLAAWVDGAESVDKELDPLRIYDQVRQVGNALSKHVPEKAAAALAPLLGYGPGLTPSGDDVVLGVLLLLNRWLAAEWGQAGLSEFNSWMTTAARKSTTALSSTLIECAADGQADEGVIMAADYLASGVGEEAACVESLLGWGSNSGIDTLAGMAVALNK